MRSRTALVRVIKQLRHARLLGAVQAYENHMFERVMPAARDSAEGAATQLSHDSLALSLAHLHHHLTPQ